MRRNLILFLTLAVVLLLGSCAKEGPTGPTGPAGPSLTGSISGHVDLIDKYGSKVLTAYDLVTITLGGSPNSIHPDSTTGGYTFASLITGVYSISAYATGYDYTERDNIQFVSGSMNVDIKLSAVPDSFLNSFAVRVNAVDSSDTLVVTCTADPRKRSFIVFLNSNDTVSNSTRHYLLNYIGSIPANATTASIYVPRQDLLNAGFVPGDSVHYAAYSYVVNDESYYEDVYTGKYLYYAINSNPLYAAAIAP